MQNQNYVNYYGPREALGYLWQDTHNWEWIDDLDSDSNYTVSLRYGDELLDKKLITENEYNAYRLKARELEARCGMGEKLNIKDFALNNERDMPVVSDVEEYKSDEKSA